MNKIAKYLGEGIFNKRVKSMEADLEKKYGRAGSKVVDKVYDLLMKMPEYKKLSMDRQGEIAMAVAKMIGGSK